MSNKNVNMMSRATRKPKINLLLLGKIGNGKSSTGNTLSGSKHFDASPNYNPETVSISKHSEVDIKGFTFVMYDTQGLMEPKEADYGGIIQYTYTMEMAIKCCEDDGGLHAFLLVFNKESKFSHEDGKCVKLLENVFGEVEFWKRCIIVITRVDYLEVDFQCWLEEQKNDFKELIEKCEARVTPIINKEKHEHFDKYREQLINLIINLKNFSSSTYRLDDFQKNELGRNSFLVEFQLEMCKLGEDLEKRIAELKNKAKDRPQHKKDEITSDIAVLEKEIKDTEKGTGKLVKYLQLLNEVKEINNKQCIIS